ncbi:MAG: translocation/assembly module TamB [Rhizobiaceae bacterium]|nr:translocation/assembly module TamB [Rhizobiaceae bacterium]
MKRLRRALRILTYLLLVVIVLGAGALAALTLTAPGRETLAGMISSLASSETQTVTVGGLSGLWSGNLRVDHVVLEDADGPWLVARGVEAEWSPFDLVRGEVNAERVSAQRVEVARLPKGGDASDEPLALPVDIDIRRLELPVVALGGEIAGNVAEVAASGSFSAKGEPLALATDLSVERRDGRQGSLTASIDFAPADNRLVVDISGAEPQGGVIANFLRLPGAPPVEIKLAGAGLVSDWEGSGTFAVDGQVVTRLDATHQTTDRGRRVEARGAGEYESFVPAMLQPLLAGQASFDVAATLLATGGIDIERATLSTTAASASASGQYDPAGATDLAVDIAAADGRPVTFRLGSETEPADVALSRLSLRAFGAGDAPAVDASAVVATLSTRLVEASGLTVRAHSDAFDLAALTGPVTLEAEAEAVGSTDQTLASLLAGAVSTRIGATVGAAEVVIAPSTIESGTLTGSVSGTVSRTDGTFALDVKGDVLSTALPAAARPLLAERAAIAATVSRDAEQRLSLQNLAVTSGDFAAGGSVTLGDETIEAAIEGALGDVGRLASGTGGSIRFAVNASGARTAPNVEATVTSEAFTAAGRTIENLELAASGVASSATPAADVRLSGTVSGEALAGTATLVTEAGKREVRDLALSLGDNRIAGTLALDDAFLPQGTVDFSLPNLGPLAALALEQIEGDATGTIRFGTAAGAPEIVVDAKSQSVRRGDLTASGVSVAASVRNYLLAPTVAGKVTAATVVSGATSILGLDLTLGRDGEWTSFAGGATIGDIPAKAAGRVRVAAAATTVELASAQATVRGLEAVLARPSTIVVRDGITTLDRLPLTVGRGNVQITGSIGDRLNLDVQIASLPASTVDRFAPGLGASGTISGTARVTGATANPEIGYAIDWTGAQTAQTTEAGFGAMTVASSGTLANGRLRLTASAGDSSGLGLRGGGDVIINGARTVTMDFSGTVPFGFLTRRLAAQGLSLTGGANVSLTVRGPLGAPQVGGTIRSQGARFTDSRSGIAVNDIDASITIAGGVATIERLTGAISSGGTLTGSGTVAIDAGGGFPADLRLQIANGRYTDGEIVTTTLDGDISVRGPLTAAPLLAGTVNLGRTVIQVPNRLPTALATLDVQHRNAPAAVERQAEAIRPAAAGSGSSGGITLDLQVNAPQQIFVQGRGLDAELGGSLRLTGPLASPRAIGSFTLRRGRLQIASKRLDFSRGSLSFSGSLVPDLDFVAESQATDATVSIQVSGPATDPRFSFSSTPSLPEDEVLARLVFGRSMGSLSALQIAQLAEDAAILAGIGSTSLLTTLRSKLGVDDIDVKTDAAGRSSVAVGKYLNERTYVTIEKGEGGGSGKATIDLDIGRGVKLRGEASDSGKAKGGIFYEREY